MILRILYALIARLDQAGLLQIAVAVLTQQVGRIAWEGIEQLVAWADELDLPGEDKMKAVIEALTDPRGPYYEHIKTLSTPLIRRAIETAVERLRELK